MYATDLLLEEAQLHTKTYDLYTNLTMVYTHSHIHIYFISKIVSQYYTCI